MYSFLNLEPVHHFMSGCNSCFSTCIQIPQEVHKVVWYSHVFQNFPQFVVIHTVKGWLYSIKQMFFWNSCFFYDPVGVGNLISGSPAFSKSSLDIWKFTIHGFVNWKRHQSLESKKGHVVGPILSGGKDHIHGHGGNFLWDEIRLLTLRKKLMFICFP